MIHYLRYCCAMFFALISFLLAPPQRAQAQTREAYVAQSADKTTLTFYYDDQRATRTGKSWGIEETRDYTLPAWAGTYQVPDSTTTRVVFEASFRNFRPTSTALWFYKCSALEQIEGFQYLNTSEVKDMSGMFSDCSGLTSLDLSHFNTQNVTDMRAMFLYCSGLTSLDVSHFNTQNVTDMRAMFYECSALATISSNTAWQCPQSKEMFAGCTKLKGAVPYDQNKTDVTMANPETGYFTRSNDGGVEAYVAQSADKTTLTFYYDDQRATRTGTTWGIEETKKERGYTFPVWAGTWAVADSTTTRVVFDASFRDFRPTTTAEWFCNYRELKQVEGVEYLNPQNVTDMRGMFWGCSGLTSLDLSNFNTQNVTDMSFMFSGCSGLTSLDLSHFNTQNVTSMESMFYRCLGLTSLVVSHFNTQNVTSMQSMFAGCWVLTSLDVSHFNTQNVTDMQSMFQNCSGLTSLDVSHFNTQNVKYMYGMFWDCRRLPSLDVSHFNTQKVTDMSRMFSDCSALTTVNSNTAWQCPQSEEMFAGCTKLKGAVAYDENKTDVTMANPETGYFTRSNGGGVEAYVAQSADKTTLTFYYDDQRATRTGTTWGIEETKEEGNVRFPVWAGTYQVADSTTTRVVLDASFRNFRPTTTACWFFKCINLTQIEGFQYLNTQNVTGMNGMFYGCSGLTSLDVKNFNTQNVTTMWTMFSGCSGLTSLDLSHFNTQNVTDMDGMFSGCSGLTSLDLSHFNTQNVTDMSGMFLDCSVLTSLDLKNFNTQNVTSMRSMFQNCSGLTSLDLSHFNTQNVTDMSAMFLDCSGLTSLDLKNFNTQNVTDMSAMFANCKELTSLDVSHFNTQNVTNMVEMFSGCKELTSLDVSHFNTQNVTDMSTMFSGCKALTSLDVSHFNTQNVTNMYGMFQGCYGLTSLDVKNFNTQHVTNMNGLFDGCSGLTSLDVKNFNTQNVTNMGGMFYGCSGLTSLGVSHFDTQNVTSMGGMFWGCSGLTSIDVSHFDTQNVTSMGTMFANCKELTSLDVSHFNTQNVTDMRYMFYGCSALTTIRGNTAWQCPQSEEMFAGCTKLKGAVAYDESKTDAKMANPETGYFTAKPTAVESVRFGADGAQQIYTLQGKRVRGAWKHLPAGVYVVNGKRTVKP